MLVVSFETRDLGCVHIHRQKMQSTDIVKSEMLKKGNAFSYEDIKLVVLNSCLYLEYKMVARTLFGTFCKKLKSKRKQSDC